MPDTPPPILSTSPPPPAPAPAQAPAQAKEQRIARILLGAAMLALGIFVLEGFLRALAWAVVLAVATRPLYLRAKSRFRPGPNDILLPLLFTIVSTLVVLVPLVLVAIEAGHEARSVAEWVRDARDHGLPLPAALAELPAGQAQVTTWWNDNLANPEGARAMLGRVDTEVMGFGRNYGSRILHTIVNLIFTLVTLFFLYRNGPILSLQLLDLSRRLFGPHGETMARQIVASIHGTVDGLVLVGIGEGLILGIAYAVAGIPHPALLGAATAIGAMIPLGATAALAIACLLALAAGNTLAASIVAVFGVVVIFAADHLVRPALIGGTTKLPFLWVLLGILGGVESSGLLGLFVGPAVMAALILLWREWVGNARTQP